MFLDLAYTIRSILHNCGFDQPDLVGLFLLPPLDGTRTQVMALGNMVAALQELNYFGSPGTRFFAQYGDRDLIVESTDPPFSRYFLLPMPEEADEVACREVYDLAAQFLYRDLFTGLGKTADLARAGLPSTPWQQRGQFYSTFGLYQLSWPRRALVRRTARALCLQLLKPLGLPGQQIPARKHPGLAAGAMGREGPRRGALYQSTPRCLSGSSAEAPRDDFLCPD